MHGMCCGQTYILSSQRFQLAVKCVAQTLAPGFVFVEVCGQLDKVS